MGSAELEFLPPRAAQLLVRARERSEYDDAEVVYPLLLEYDFCRLLVGRGAEGARLRVRDCPTPQPAAPPK